MPNNIKEWRRQPDFHSNFEDNASSIMSLPLPSITVAKAYAGREKVVEAFEKYYAANGQESASRIIQKAIKLTKSYGLSANDIARLEPCNGHAFLANTSPTAFWTLYHLFSDSAILKKVREAVTPLFSQRGEDGTVVWEADVSKVREIPILRSLLHECLRHYGIGTGTRIVMEDTMLDDRYLLKKDSFIFMPNESFHSDAAAWGPTVKDFDAERFIRAPGQKSHHPGAFLGFGGGTSLCPGRFFAQNEILAMCAMMAMRFDVKPRDGVWKNPGTNDANMSYIVLPPKQKVFVDIIPREGWLSCKMILK